MRSEVKLVLGGKSSCVHTSAVCPLSPESPVTFPVLPYRFSTGEAGKKSSAFGIPGATQNGKAAGEMGMSAGSMRRWRFFTETLGRLWPAH